MFNPQFNSYPTVVYWCSVITCRVV